jgi:prepilin-type N-terminal cleavage/methylation domain-containing protein
MDLSKARSQRGFTMIEVMLVVVIIGIISSIAIPYYTRMSARAYRSEMLTTLSKMELYFKNIYENQGNYTNPSIVALSDVMPDPNNTVPVGQGADWKPTLTGGWNDLPFPPQGNIRMRYQYQVGVTNGSPSVTFTVCGNFPGFGGANIAFGSHGALCNYLYTEILTGTIVDAKNNVFESPPQAFE